MLLTVVDRLVEADDGGQRHAHRPASASPSGETRAEGRTQPRRRRSKPPSTGKPIRDIIIWALLASAIAGSVLAVGTVHTKALLAIAPLALLAGLVAVRAQAPWTGFPAPAAVFAALAFYCSLQAMPMPLEWLRVLSPEASRMWISAATAVGETREYAPISLDPTATIREAFKWLSYAGLFVASATLGARRGAQRLVEVVFATATLAALVTVVHRALDAEALFGIYHPVYVTPDELSPLLNGNNFAGYLLMGALCGFGLILSGRSTGIRGSAAAGTTLCVAMIPGTGSRAGTFALAVGLLTLACWVFSRRGNQSLKTRRASLALAGAVLVSILVTVLWINFDSNTFATLSHLESRKLQIPGRALGMIRDYTWFGSGRGSFESVFPAYGFGSHVPRFAYAENVVTQWVTEWGLLVALAALNALAWMFRPSRMALHRDWANRAAYIAALALIMQNFADLGLELPSLSYGLLALLGGLWGEGALKNPSETIGAPEQRGKGPYLFAGTVASVIAFAAVLAQGSPSPDTDRYRMLASYDSMSRPTPAPELTRFTEELHGAILRHPAEPTYFRLGALVARRQGTKTEQAWIDQALVREPHSAFARIIAADIQTRSGDTAGAIQQLRLAAHTDPGAYRKIAKRVARLHKDYESILSAVPNGPRHAPLFAELANHVADPGLAARLLERGLRLNETATMHVQRGHLLLDAVEAKTAPCTQRLRACLDAALKHGERGAKLEPLLPTPRLLMGRVVRVLSGPKAAVRFLARHCAQLSDKHDCLYVRAQFAFDVNRSIASTASFDFLNTVCPGDTSGCATVADRFAEWARARAYSSLAAKLSRHAARRDPTAVRWVAAAEDAVAVHNVGASRSALEQAERLVRDENAPIHNRISRARARLRRELIGTASD